PGSRLSLQLIATLRAFRSPSLISECRNRCWSCRERPKICKIHCTFRNLTRMSQCSGLRHISARFVMR
ncbi:unnamed protein product, partial [Mycena citricolor]